MATPRTSIAAGDQLEVKPGQSRNKAPITVENFFGGGATPGGKFFTFTSGGIPQASAVLTEGTGTLTVTDAANVVLGTTTGSKVGTATAQKLGFWNATPVIQYATTGTTTGFTAATGTTVVSGSTFTGNTGSAAYTISDIVRALKLAGIMAA